jgi:hypothetical protein
MNIAMEQTQEFQNGQLKAQYGDCFIRGNNGAEYRGKCCRFRVMLMQNDLLSFMTTVLYISASK